VNTYEMLTHGQ